MVGVETVEQLKEALAYEGATAAERDYASVLAGAPKHAYMGQCTYCGHCAPCTVGINIALSNKFADLAEMAGEVPASVAAHYKAMDVTAGACIACGDCEPRCPFDDADHRAHGKDGGALRLLNEPANFGVFSIRAG
ncbi:MAG: 4Fe-4S dicluster domain-containing protein [Adlercreutzia equolifaciens]